VIPDGFEWDEEKAKSNLRKHGVSFAEAATVFNDPLCLIMDDPNHSIREQRFLILGYFIASRLLLVVHCERDEVIRMTSARPATPSEQRHYEQGL
jgi:uncharacterized DUF497 family protein